MEKLPLTCSIDLSTIFGADMQHTSQMMFLIFSLQAQCPHSPFMSCLFPAPLFRDPVYCLGSSSFFDSSAMFTSSAACFVCFIALLPLCIFRYQVWSHAAGRLATQSFWTSGNHVARLRQNRIFEGCMEGCVGGGERWASCRWRLPICRWGRMHKLHDMYGGCSEHFQDHWLPRWTWQ